MATWIQQKGWWMVNGRQVKLRIRYLSIFVYLYSLGILKALINFFSFLTLGPSLPKALIWSSMVELGDNLYIIGGRSNDGSSDQREIHQLSCFSGLCSWTTLTQQLKVAREYQVVIPIDDTFCPWIGLQQMLIKCKIMSGTSMKIFCNTKFISKLLNYFV